MARQLVFTSAPQGLTPGRTGYCTVARHRDLRERLALLLEGLSAYPSDWQPAPVICSYRLLDFAGSSVPVLSRIVAAGQDYSHRAIFLAHHLILDPAEITDAPSPADVFLRWPGWRPQWDGPPVWFEESDLVDLRQLSPAREPALPAQTWECLAGDAGRAALLLDGAKPRAWQLGCDPVGEEYLLALFRESSALLEPAEAWRTEFTTCLPSLESARSYKWAALRLGSPVDTPAARIGDFLDLTHPESLPPAPNNPATQRARLGHLPPPPIPLPEPTAAIPPIIPQAVSVEKSTSPPIVGAKPDPASPSIQSAKRPHSPNKLWLIAALAAVLLLGLILLAGYFLLFHFQPPTASPTPHSQPPLAGAAPLSPPAATQRNRILPPPPPAPAVQPTQPSPIAASGINAPKPKSNFSLALPNHAVLDLLWVEPGSFTMGSPDSETGRNKDEGPQSQVTLTQGFWLGKYDVTQEQWIAVMGDNPSDPKHLSATIPVDTVSWDLAMAFCRLLTQQEYAAGRLPPGYEYTLPTEAQWEYACHAGGAPAPSGHADDLAWYGANSGGTSHRSGLKQPNAWGFFDLHGNIMQWCRDWYAARYPRGSVTDPAGPATGTRHVARGGNYASLATDLRDARRFPHPLNYQNNGLGLRLALAPVAK